MQHEALLRLALEGVYHLLIRRSSERGYRQALCLPPGEQAGSVSPGEQAYLAAYRPDLIKYPAVNPNLLVYDKTPHLFSLDLDKGGPCIFIGIAGLLGREFRDELL